MGDIEREAVPSITDIPRMSARVLGDVAAERLRQDKKWGDQSTNSDLLWAAIHGEEYGEVCQAILAQKDTDADDLYAELIQLAATCVAHAEALRVRGVK